MARKTADEGRLDVLEARLDALVEFLQKSQGLAIPDPTVPDPEPGEEPDAGTSK